MSLIIDIPPSTRCEINITEMIVYKTTPTPNKNGAESILKLNNILDKRLKLARRGKKQRKTFIFSGFALMQYFCFIRSCLNFTKLN